MNVENEDVNEEYFYCLLNENYNPTTGYLYDLHSNDISIAKGATYNPGDAMLVDSNIGSRLIYWLARDGGARS